MHPKILLIVNSFVTDKDPRRGAKFRLQLQAYVERGFDVSLVAIHQRDYHLMDCLRSHSFVLSENHCGAPVTRDCTYHTLFRYMPFLRRQEVSARIALRSVRKHINAFGRPDLIHAHGSTWAGVTALAANKRWGIPYVVTEHMNNYVMGTVPKRALPLMKRLFANAEMRLPISKTAGERIESILGKSFRPWTPVPNMLDASIFHRKPERDTRVEQPVLLSVSHLNSKKRFDILLEALALVLSRRKVALRIGGDGPERQRLHEIAARLDILQHVTFLGPLSRSDVAHEMGNADAYVVSSDYETFGIPVIEAQASGLPVVSTRCGGPEDFIHEKNGVLVQPGDPQALAMGIENLLQRIESYDREAIMNECRLRYSPGAVIERLEDIYARALSGPQFEERDTRK